MRALLVAPFAHVKQALRRTFKRGETARRRLSFDRRRGTGNTRLEAAQDFRPAQARVQPAQGHRLPERPRDRGRFLYGLPQGENTLTVRNGERTLLKALLHSKS